MIMLHSKKKESILAWIQSTGGTHIQSLKQLSDGIIFYRLIQTLSDKTHEQINNTSGTISDDNIKTANFSEGLVKEQVELQNVTNVSFQNENKCKSETVVSCINENNLEQDLVIDDCQSDSEKTDTEEIVTKDSGVDVNGIIQKKTNQDSLNELSVINELHSETHEAFTRNISRMETSLDENKSGNSNCESNHLVNNGDLNGDLHLESHTEDSGAYSLVDTSSSDDVNLKQKTIEETDSRYNVVQHFIENMLELKSEELVNYASCIKGIEFELAKVTVLILSALIQYSISSKADHITATCCGLSFEAQEEIKDCLELFLSERSTAVEKKEFHAKLARASKPRISPRKNAFVSTPLHNTTRQTRKRQTRKQLENKVMFIEEELESPIQSLLKSPLIKMTPNSEARLLDAMRYKDRTIALLTYDLDEEKCNVSDLKKQNEDLKSELHKLKKEMEKLKLELTETCDLLTKQELSFEDIKQNLEKELKNSQNKIDDLEKDIAFLREESQKENIDNSSNSIILEKTPCCDMKEKLENLKCSVQAKEDKILELLSENESLQMHMARIEFNNEELKSKLALQADLKEVSNFIPPVEEKCFNVVDLTVRNDLRDKCDELQQCLESQKTEYEKKIKKLKEQLSNKESKEKDWKTLFRKADRDREDAVKWRKKLEEENIKLKAENNLYVKICPNVVANLNSTLSSNRQLITTNSSCESEKIGHLWNLYDEKSSGIEELFITTDQSHISPRVQPKTKSQCNLSGSKVDSLQKKDLSKRRSNSLSPKSIPNHSKSESDSILMETSHVMSNGRLSCTEKEFSTIKTLVKNITKNFLEKSYQNEVFTELQTFSENFNNVKDLINVLTLFYKIVTDEFIFKSNLSLNSTQPKRFDIEKDVQLQKLTEEIVNLKKEMRKLKPISIKEPIIKEVTKLENQRVSKRKTDDLSILSEKVLTLEGRNKELEKNFLQSQNTVKVYKSKVLSLELKLKELKNVKLILEKNNISLESAKNVIEEKYDISCKENVEMMKKLSIFEKNCSKNSSTVDVFLPNADCERCLMLFEKIESFDGEKKNLEISIAFLKEDLKSIKNENNVLIQKIRSLMQEKKIVEQQLMGEKRRYTARIDPSFHYMNEHATGSTTIKKEEKANYVKTSKGSDMDDSKSVSSLKNISTMHTLDKIEENHSVANRGNSKKLIAFCKAEDEAEMLSQSSLAEVHNESPNERIKEFQRRNSLYLPHLKSVYALELNTTPTQAKYFMAPTPVSKMPISKKHPSTDSQGSFLVKKRKISKSDESALHLSSSRSITSKRTMRDKHILPEYLPSSTPKEKVSFTQRMCQTPSSFIRFRSMLKSQKSKLK